jgi:hypothetical protein
MNFRLPHILATFISVVLGASSATAQLPPGTSEVTYDPGLTRVEGDQPLNKTVYVSIKSPSNVPVGSSVSITPVLSMLSQPTGVSNSVALSYVTFNPSVLTFTGPNQTISARIDLNFPLGVDSGVYAYKFVTAGWPPGTQDLGGFLNATIYPPVTPSGPPTVTITKPTDNSTFTYQPVVGPLSVAITFTSSAPASTPITSIDADINGVNLTLSNVTNSDGSITSNTTASITAPGPYTVRARATNNDSTATDTVDFTVNVSAPPPTVAIAQPVAGSSFTLPLTGALSVPYSFTARSSYGGITSLTATFNGQPLTFTPSGLNTLTATGSGNFSLTTGGSYELVVTAVDQNGNASAKTNFTVVAATPPPTVSISQPLNGAIYTRVAGSPATVIPFSYTGLAANGYTISSLTGKLNGSALSASLTGIGTGTATGTGNLSISTGGTFTLSAVAASGSATAATSVTFTVKETQPPPPSCSVNWLPPISLGKPFKGGCDVAIKFEILCNECGIDRNGDGDPDFFPGQRTKSKINIDKSVIIAVTEILGAGNMGTPRLFPYSSTPNAPGYTIQGNDMYHLNFPAPTGAHRYRVEVFRFPTSSTAPQLLGTKEFTTK